MACAGLLFAFAVGCGSDASPSNSGQSGAANAAGASAAGAANTAGSAGTTSVAGATSAGATSGGGGATGGGTNYGAGGKIEPDIPPSYNPCANLAVCTILPLGDSITFGDQSTDQAGWRSRLFHLTLQNNEAITFVGGQTNGPDTVDGVPFPNHHEGHPGYEISGPHGIEYFTAQSVMTFPPQILTLMIGTNDMANVDDTPNAPKRLEELIDLILSTDSKLLMVVAQITPTQDDDINALIQTYNAAIPAIVSARAAAGKHIALIDMWTALASNPNYKTEYLANKLHPNDAGYTKMAETWYKMLGGLFPAKQ